MMVRNSANGVSDGLDHEEDTHPHPKDDKFTLLLAASVHDMKNSLGMLLCSLGDMMHEFPAETDPQKHRYQILQGEASRIRGELVYLLGLYRLQREEMPIHIEEVFVDEFLRQQIALNHILFEVNEIEIDCNCDPQLLGYFDLELMANVVGNVLVNAAKYTKDKISICAEVEQEGVRISISDNGSGYPERMILSQGEFMEGINFSSGSTFLGLSFSARIAEMHTKGDEKGHISLSNLEGGGGCFSIQVP